MGTASLTGGRNAHRLVAEHMSWQGVLARVTKDPLHQARQDTGSYRSGGWTHLNPRSPNLEAGNEATRPAGPYRFCRLLDRSLPSLPLQLRLKYFG